jgi:hypothetical protein
VLEHGIADAPIDQNLDRGRIELEGVSRPVYTDIEERCELPRGFLRSELPKIFEGSRVERLGTGFHGGE